MALHVYLAMNIAGIRGVYVGARSMYELGVPLDVALRVLARSATQRRPSDPTQHAS